MLDGTVHPGLRLRVREESHLVVPAADLLRHAAQPGLDLSESALVLVVPGVADIHALVGGQATRAALEEACDVHHIALVEDVLGGVVPVLAGLEDLLGEEVLLEVVDRLIGVVVPTSVDAPLAAAFLPYTEDLSDNGLVVGVAILDMDPVA